MGNECKYINSKDCMALDTMTHAEKIAKFGDYVDIGGIKQSTDYVVKIGKKAVKQSLCSTPEHVKCPSYLILEKLEEMVKKYETPQQT